MNILMLGNGFDLYHKLPTTYLCFLKTVEYIKDNDVKDLVIWSIFNKLKSDCSDIDKSFNEYNDFYHGYFFDDSDKKAIEQIKSISSNNYWLKYFLRTYNKELGWIDFEKEIAKVVRCFSNISINDYINGTKKLSTEERLIIGSFNYFSTFINESIEINGNGSKRIIPRHLELKEEYFIEYPYGSGERIVNEEKIIAKLYHELRNLAEMLKIYLEVFVNKPLKKMKDMGVAINNPVFTDYDQIVSFNYTDTYSTLYDNTKTHYIHGELGKDIVLGINPDKYDETDYLDTSYIMFKKYYQRVYYRTDNSYIKMVEDEVNDLDSDNRELNSLVVCGHSLDVTDKEIIEALFYISDYIFIVCHNLTNIGKYVKNLIAIYGKGEFDRLRNQKHLEFITYEEWEKRKYFDMHIRVGFGKPIMF